MDEEATAKLILRDEDENRIHSLYLPRPLNEPARRYILSFYTHSGKYIQYPFFIYPSTQSLTITVKGRFIITT